MEKIKIGLADATADLSFGRNKEKHLLIINECLKQIADYLRSNNHDPGNIERIEPMVVGYMLYQLKEIAIS